MILSMLLFFCKSSYTQVYTYTLTQGWRATRCLEVSTDSLLVVGLNSKNLQQDYQKHRIEFNYLNTDRHITSNHTFNAPNRILTTTHSAASIFYDRFKGIIVGGSSSFDDTVYSSVNKFNIELNLIKNIEQKTEKNDFTYSLLSFQNKYYKLGVTQRLDPPSSRTRVSLSSMDKDLMQIAKLNEYQWNHFQDYGGCNLLARNMLVKEDHFYISAVGRANSVQYANLQDGLILKVYTLGMRCGG